MKRHHQLIVVLNISPFHSGCDFVHLFEHFCLGEQQIFLDFFRVFDIYI